MVYYIALNNMLQKKFEYEKIFTIYIKFFLKKSKFHLKKISSFKTLILQTHIRKHSLET